MIKIKLRFVECEHNGDLDNYAEDVIVCGGTIISKKYKESIEEGIIICDIKNLKEFLNKMDKTDSSGFYDTICKL